MVTLSQSIAFSFLTKHLSHTVAVRMFCSLKCNSKANMNFFFLVHDFTDRRLALSVCVCVCVCAHALSCFSQFQLFVTLWSVARQVPLPMGFSRQEYCIRFPFPSPGNLAYPGIEPGSLMSPALADGFFTTSATWEAPVDVSNLRHMLFFFPY